jgi:lipid-binding SYLF domain-containing protein
MEAPQLVLTAALGLAICGPGFAQTKEVLDAGAAETVKQFNLLGSGHEDLLRKAAGILIFPQVIKGGIAVASEYGEGVLQVDGKTVDYYSVAAASVGLTAGMATHSEIALFMTPEALEKFRNSKGWSIGADTGIAVVSKGMAEDRALELKKPVLVFLFAEKGLMADLSLRGTKINKIKKKGSFAP